MGCRNVAAVVLLVLAGPAVAQPGTVIIPQDALGEQDPAGVALVEAFGRFCLDRFPGAARVEDAAPGQTSALPPARVRDYLHDDPGRGWIYRADGGAYVVTIEDPPYHTCAIRREYAVARQSR